MMTNQHANLHIKTLSNDVHRSYAKWLLEIITHLIMFIKALNNFNV